MLETYRDEYMNRCKGPRGKQKVIIEKAKEEGIPIRALRAKLAMRAINKRKANVARKLEPDDRELLDKIHRALADDVRFPLFGAAPAPKAAEDRGATAIASIAGAAPFVA